MGDRARSIVEPVIPAVRTDALRLNAVTESYNDDNSLLRDVGRHFTISDQEVGRGAYGNVYLATDENGRQVAVKCCDIDPQEGIPNILEASIMASTVHPYLNRALRIQASESRLYIIQELAKTDMAQHTRAEKSNYRPDIGQLRSWCYYLAQAVYSLHNEGIIHADIKASNVLLYEDGLVRLTDYTLATKRWTPEGEFLHNACTCTHRPLECLLEKPWSTPLDIWSLGCTFYEIAYGQLLFQYQGILEPDLKKQNREVKQRIRARSINAILDWHRRYDTTPCPDLPAPYSCEYLQVNLAPDFQRPELAEFNDLLLKMLTVAPKRRLTITQVIKHPFFKDMKAPRYLSVTRLNNRLTLPQQSRAVNYIQRYTKHAKVQEIALHLYSQCNDLNHLPEHIRTAGCTWIASKLVTGRPPIIELPTSKILAVEREICHNLCFRLHTLS